jgi:HK97 gp10 family phage protein
MQGDGISAKVSGLPDLKAALAAIPRELRRRALRTALAAGARAVRDEAKRRAPVLKASTYAGASAIRRGVRKPGTLQKAIVVRTSKVARRAGNVGVFVNVRPAKGGNRGAKSPNDPYYWRWQEFGWNSPGGSKPGAKFLQAGAAKLLEALRIFGERIGPQLAKFNVTGKGTTL